MHYITLIHDFFFNSYLLNNIIIMTVLNYESNVEWSAVMILVSRVMMSIAELMTCIFADVTSVTVRRLTILSMVIET